MISKYKDLYVVFETGVATINNLPASEMETFIKDSIVWRTHIVDSNEDPVDLSAYSYLRIGIGLTNGGVPLVIATDVQDTGLWNEADLAVGKIVFKTGLTGSSLINNIAGNYKKGYLLQIDGSIDNVIWDTLGTALFYIDNTIFVNNIPESSSSSTEDESTSSESSESSSSTGYDKAILVSATNTEINVASNPTTTAYEVLSGTNLLVVTINSAHTDETLDLCPSSITYNGVALTLIAAQNVPTTQIGCVSTWYLFNPTVGTYNLVVNYLNTPNAGAKGWFYQFSNIDGEEAPTYAGTTNPSSGLTVSTNLVTTVKNELIIATAGTGGGTTGIVWTQNNGIKLDSAVTPRCTTGYWINTGTAGTKNITNTYSANVTMCQLLVAFKPIQWA